ncbi:MAG TPA: hypothetical protein VJ570_03020 [Holophagaceae bacterium]|nr:hypothetical protein [Holophagaceae bacterium]
MHCARILPWMITLPSLFAQAPEPLAARAPFGGFTDPSFVLSTLKNDLPASIPDRSADLKVTWVTAPMAPTQVARGQDASKLCAPTSFGDLPGWFRYEQKVLVAINQGTTPLFVYGRSLLETRALRSYNGGSARQPFQAGDLAGVQLWEILQAPSAVGTGAVLNPGEAFILAESYRTEDVRRPLFATRTAPVQVALAAWDAKTLCNTPGNAGARKQLKAKRDTFSRACVQFLPNRPAGWLPSGSVESCSGRDAWDFRRDFSTFAGAGAPALTALWEKAQ